MRVRKCLNAGYIFNKLACNEQVKCVENEKKKAVSEFYLINRLLFNVYCFTTYLIISFSQQDIYS
jgi:hypothetical protein